MLDKELNIGVVNKPNWLVSYIY